MPVICQEYMLFFCVALSFQPRAQGSTHNSRGAHTQCGAPPLSARTLVVGCCVLVVVYNIKPCPRLNTQ